MPKVEALTPLAAGFITSATLNDKLTKIEEAFENTLSRDGSTPNAMEAPLDMNTERIINLPAPTTATEPVRLTDLEDLADAIGATTALLTSISDVGGYFVSENVEGALQEIGADLAALGTPLEGVTTADNTALGDNALDSRTTGVDNTGIGVNALTALTDGNDNTAVGDGAGDTITTGDDCTIIGSEADVDNANAQNRIAIGKAAVCETDNFVQLGNSLTTGGKIGPTGIMLQGKHTVPVLAEAFRSRTTNGAADGLTETTTNKVMLVTKDFDGATDEFIQIRIPIPKGTSPSQFTYQLGWFPASGSGDVRWSCAAVAISNDDVLDAAFGTAVIVTDSVIATTDLHVTDESAAVTPAGTPVVGDTLVIQVSRNSSNALDTLNGIDAKLWWAKFFFTVSAGNDA